jgi:excisionase family DNA binding protein
MKVTPKQAAERAGVSLSLIYLWCEERRLPHFRLGSRGRRGRILIDEGDLHSFLESMKVPAGAPDALPPESPPNAGGFTMLDPGRLREAWRRRGGSAGRTGGGSAPSSS